MKWVNHLKPLPKTDNIKAYSCFNEKGEQFIFQHWEGYYDQDPSHQEQWVSSEVELWHLVKLDSGNNEIWKATLKADYIAPKLKATADGGVIIYGKMNGQISDESAGSKVIIPYTSGSPGFCFKFKDGQLDGHWFNQRLTSSEVKAVDEGKDSTIHILGDFTGQLGISPGASQASFTSMGSTDGFWAKFDEDFNVLDSGQIGAIDNQFMYDINVGPQSMLIAGRTAYSRVYFNMDSLADMATFSQGKGAFVAKYDLNGSFLDSVTMEGDKGRITKITALDTGGYVFYASCYPTFIYGSQTFNNPRPTNSLGSKVILYVDSLLALKRSIHLYGDDVQFPNDIMMYGDGELLINYAAKDSVVMDDSFGSKTHHLTSHISSTIPDRPNTIGTYTPSISTFNLLAHIRAKKPEFGFYWNLERVNQTVRLRIPFTDSISIGSMTAPTWNYGYGNRGNQIFADIDSSGTTQINGAYHAGYSNAYSSYISKSNLDKDGNLWSVIAHAGTVDVGLHPDTLIVGTNVNEEQIEIVKFKESGKPDLAYQLCVNSANRYVEIDDISNDPYNNVYLFGTFKDSIDFDVKPGTTILYGDSTVNVFIAKYDSTMTLLFAKVIATGNDDLGIQLADINDSTIAFYGSFKGQMEFGNAVKKLESKNPLSYDGFLAHYDLKGQFHEAIWLENSINDNIWVRGLTVDKDGNYFICGNINGTVAFGKDSVSGFLSSPNDYNGFIAGYSKVGDSLRMKVKIATAGVSDVYGIDIGSNGRVYALGYFSKVADFDGTGPAPTLNSGGVAWDLFVASYTTKGSFNTAYRLGDHWYESATSIHAHSSGKISIMGSSNYDIDMDLKTGVHTLKASSGKSKLFLATYTNTFDLLRATRLSEGYSHSFNNHTYKDYFYNIAKTKRSQPYDVNLNSSQNLYYSYGVSDDLIIKYGSCSHSFSSITDTVCKSYISPSGKQFKKSGTYTDTILNAQGCDSIITLNLVIHKRSFSEEVITACDTYTWTNGKIYTSSNFTATDTLANKNGCDSIVSLKLTVNHSYFSVDTISSCGPLLWTDSVVYQNSTLIIDSLNTVAGCDSILSTMLLITNIDTTVSNNDPVLQANEPDATYQWLDCQHGLAPIVGSTNAVFSPTTNGLYAVEITKNGCVDTSACQSIQTIGLDEDHEFRNIQVFPNPSSGIVSIALGDIRKASITVINTEGQIVYQSFNMNGPLVQIDLKVSTGVYFMVIGTEQFNKNIKLIIH